MANSQKHLDAVYRAQSAKELAAVYDDWSESYDDDLTALGHGAPTAVIALVCRHVAPDAGPLLDCGAGTGRLGQWLSWFGYGPITGFDISDGMLAKARERDAYAELRKMALGEHLDFPDRSFATAVAAGVFTAQHAPAESFEEICRVVRPGGQVVFSIRCDADKGDAYLAKADELEARGIWRREGECAVYPVFAEVPEKAHITNQVLAYRLL